MLVKMKCYMEVGEVGTRNEDTHWRVEHMQFVGVGAHKTELVDPQILN